ncbi:C4-dicarboxylate TRAP transporter substrate-binding protein [Treponema parvum]|uniref:C4-dicarboxylate TRAP transporter substrate-binding protein n=1 Tax=Treponema parvum TaxID=138851 RepID=UPI001AEBCBBA|nr:C4-dicarboxylate TRAP transporter substrate-binding protein [Treponema parvum]QTQ17049.1 TRAP transporter substrate-binding protein DctP [Treponema parvum]
MLKEGSRKFVCVLALSVAVVGMVFAGGANESSAAKKMTIQIGFENSMSEPVGQALKKWQSLVAEKGDGSLVIELFPDSQLGSKNKLIDSMLLGEPVMTLADGAFYADYGVKDMGIVFGPFLFENWDQCWKLIESDWYKQQSSLLEKKGLKLVSSNWIYGDRHTLTVKPVKSVKDLKGMKIRVPSNQIQTEGMNVLGAAATGMSLGDVYQALQSKTIDGAENPLSTLYGRKLQEVAKYLILDGHVKNFTTWVCSAAMFNSLTKSQQELLVSTGNEAGVYNNKLQDAAQDDYLKKMKAEGVQVVEMTPALQKEFRDAAMPFYDKGSQFGWSQGLYRTVRKAMGEN